MGFRVGQSNFSKGELGPELIGRFDVPTYNAGLKRARNVCVLKYGGITKRPGTRAVAEVYDGDNPVRLLPFQFNNEQAYVLEKGQSYMRPIALGGLLLDGEKTITAITKAANARITINSHGYSVGDQIFFRGIEGMVEMNGRVGTVVSIVNANQFSVDIDSTNFTVFASASNEPSDLPNYGIGGLYNFDWRAFLEQLLGLRF